MRSIWLLDHGAAGHFAQVAGVADMLERAGFDGPREIVHVDVSIPGWLRGGLRMVGSHAPRILARPMIGAFNAMSELPVIPPALILGSGGTSTWALRLLGWQTGAATVHVGPWEPFPRDWFTYGLSPDTIGPNNVATDFLISRMTPDSAKAAAHARYGQKLAANQWALMIGGRSRSHHFVAEDWIALADSVNARASAAGIRWLISTSPRTGAEAEAILAERINPEVIADLVLWGRTPEKCAAAFMGAAEHIFVTRDSLTMMSEAIASGTPTTVVTPQSNHLGEGFFKRMIERLQDEKWVNEVSCASLALDRSPVTVIDSNRFSEREKRIVSTLAAELAS